MLQSHVFINPVILDKNCDIEQAAKKIAARKFVQAGLSPNNVDYCIIHKDIFEKCENVM